MCLPPTSQIHGSITLEINTCTIYTEEMQINLHPSISSLSHTTAPHHSLKPWHQVLELSLAADRLLEGHVGFRHQASTPRRLDPVRPSASRSRGARHGRHVVCEKDQARKACVGVHGPKFCRTKDRTHMARPRAVGRVQYSTVQ